MPRQYSECSAPSLGFDRSALPLIDIVCAVARRLWPFKTAIMVSQRAGVSVRAAEFWLGGAATSLSGEAVAELLRSDAGFEILEGIMGDRKPSWWVDFRVEVKAAALDAKLKGLAEEIERARSEFGGVQ